MTASLAKSGMQSRKSVRKLLREIQRHESSIVVWTGQHWTGLVEKTSKVFYFIKRLLVFEATGEEKKRNDGEFFIRNCF